MAIRLTGSLAVTGSITTDEVTSPILTGTASLASTSSYIAGANVDGAVTSATTSNTASYVAASNIDGTITNATSASYVTTAQTASYVAGANIDGAVATASYIAASNVDGTVTSASYALQAASSISSSYVRGDQVSGSVTRAFIAGISETASFINSLEASRLTGDFNDHILPDISDTYDLGSSSNRWRDLYLSGSTIYLGNQPITATDYAALSGSVSGKTLISSSEQINALSGVSASFATSASYAVSASHEIIFETSSSHAINADTASLATTASYAVTASYALNGGGGGGAAFPHTGSAIISGSLEVTGSVGFNHYYISDGAWATSGALIYDRFASTGTGTQNAALSIGGCSSTAPGPNSVKSITEEYNGTTWGNGGNMTCARRVHAAAGTQNAALTFGGLCTVNGGYGLFDTEAYNGSAWSTRGSLIFGTSCHAGAGTQNAALSFGGVNSSYCGVNPQTQEYDGLNWSSGGSFTRCRFHLAGGGTQNAGIAFGGHSNCTCTDEYNGSSWSSGGNMIAGRSLLGGGGTQNSALASGGNLFTCTEEYDGTTWSAGSALITGREGEGMAASSNCSAAVFGGKLPANDLTTCTEEYTRPLAQSTTFDYSSTTGETTVSCLIETSAARYKDNIQPMGSQLNKVMQLQPVEFDWKSNKKHDIGFVADSVKNVYPNLVSEKEGQVEGMNYSKLVSALVKSIQEQQTQIDELKTRLDNNN